MALFVAPPLWEFSGETQGVSEAPCGVSPHWLGEPLPLVLMSLLLAPRPPAGASPTSPLGERKTSKADVKQRGNSKGSSKRQDVLFCMRMCKVFTLPQLLRPQRDTNSGAVAQIVRDCTTGDTGLPVWRKPPVALGLRLQTDSAVATGRTAQKSTAPGAASRTKPVSSLASKTKSPAPALFKLAPPLNRYEVARTGGSRVLGPPSSHAADIEGFPWAYYGNCEGSATTGPSLVEEARDVVSYVLNQWPTMARVGGGKSSSKHPGPHRQKCSPTIVRLCDEFWLSIRTQRTQKREGDAVPFLGLVLAGVIFGIVPPVDVLRQMALLVKVDPTPVVTYGGKVGGGYVPPPNPPPVVHVNANPIAPILSGLVYGEGWKDSFGLVLSTCQDELSRFNDRNSRLFKRDVINEFTGKPNELSSHHLPTPVLTLGAPGHHFGDPLGVGFWDLLPLVLANPDTTLFYAKALCAVFPQVFTEEMWQKAQRTPFHYCWESLPFVRWLFEDCGIRLNSVEPHGSTSSLLPMVEGGRLDILRYLHQHQHPHGCHLMPWLLGESPLSFAARQDHVEILKFYIEEVGVVDQDRHLPGTQLLSCSFEDVQWSAAVGSKSLAYLESVCGYSTREKK